MITKFKIFENNFKTNSSDFNITFYPNDIDISVEYVSLSDTYENEMDDIKLELKKGIENIFKQKLNTNIHNIKEYDIYLLCLIFDTNIILNKIGYSNIEDDYLSFNFLFLNPSDFLNILKNELNDFYELKNNKSKVEELLLFHSYNNDIIDTFFYKGLWDKQSVEFKNANNYIFDAKKFDLL